MDWVRSSAVGPQAFSAILADMHQRTQNYWYWTGCVSRQHLKGTAISAPFSRVHLNNQAMTVTQPTTAVAVYCASSLGSQKAYQNAAVSVGDALAKAGRTLVYGGGRKGLMGVVSGAAIEAGGKVIGVIPYAMVVSGGEQEQTAGQALSKAAIEALFDGQNRENEDTVVVGSMHERKLEMAKQSCGFITLPGGYGSFDELLEVTTWSQLGIHNKPTIVLNVLSFYEPLRQLIRNGVQAGFIKKENETLVIFVDGPPDHAEHESFDWGRAALDAMDSWKTVDRQVYYNWDKQRAPESTSVSP
ncbi:hypothetical protein BDY19DRAFT_270476 [Irpex rosettiformis]|uniref:Uncharacterized protein n=1 Tax=Irpex rosettiformis TaxID=378272 RepID=A0ACB8UHI1_9APHY|nr:hypothetical protein BDY19DRAFT_270476 [Irpex rosettiformis]